MHGKLRALLQKQEAIVDAAKAAGRDLTEEEQKRFDALQAEIDQAKAEDDAGEKEKEAREIAIKEERERAAGITALCRSFGMDPESYIASGKSMDEVRAAVLAELAKDRAPIGNRRMEVTGDEEDKFRSAAVLGLRQRMGYDSDKERSPYAGTEFKDLAIECMEREGASAESLRHMSKDELFQHLCNDRAYMNPSAAFPSIMDATVNKTIVDAYQLVPTTFNLWTTKGSLSDFKAENVHQWEVGGVSDFEKVGENGEIKADRPSNKMRPTRKLDSYGKSFSLTREAFINDDVGLLSKTLSEYSAAAKRTIDNQVYDLLLSNAAYADGIALFDKKHGNLATTGAKPGQAGLQDALLQMGVQKDDFGQAIRVIPKYVLIGNQNQFDTYIALHSAQITGSANNDVNPMYGMALQPIIVPQLDAAASAGACPWFMVADPMSAKSIEVDYLNGAETPQVRRMEKPGVLGFHWDVFMDWGITALDFRGIYKNGGAK